MANDNDDFKPDENEVPLDDFDFNDEFDDSDFDDFDPDSRTPAQSVKDGAVMGLKETVADRSYYTNAIERSLPKGYSNATKSVLDAYDTTTTAFSKLRREAEPLNREAKKLAKTVSNNAGRFLPTSWKEKLDDYAASNKSDSVYSAPTQADLDEDTITSSLHGIFAAQAEAKDEEAAAAKAEKMVDDKRTRTLIEQLDEIRISSRNQVNYQKQVDYPFIKKSLELQYRQYFAMRDMLEVNKAMGVDLNNHLKAITINTSLPEIQKIQKSEELKQEMHRRLYGKIVDQVSPAANDVLGRFVGKLKDAASTQIAEANAAASMASMADGGSSSENIQMSSAGLSSELMRFATNKVADKVNPILAENEKVNELGAKANYYSSNYTEMIREKLNEHQTENPFMDFLRRSFLQSMTPEKNQLIHSRSRESLLDPVIWDEQSRMSLVEVIPGYLSRMLQSIEGLRTGTMGDNFTYDPAKREFITVGEAADLFREQQFNTGAMDAVDSNATNLIEEILGGTVELSDSDIAKLKTKLVTMAAEHEGFTPSKFSNAALYREAGIESDIAESIAGKLADSIGFNPLDGSIRNDASSYEQATRYASMLKNITTSLPDITSVAALHSNSGSFDVMKRSGATALHGNDEFTNFDYIVDGYKNHITRPTETSDTVRDPELSKGPYGNLEAQRAASSDSLASNEIEDLRDVVRMMKETMGLPTQNHQGIGQPHIDSIISAMKETSAKDPAEQSHKILIEMLEELRQIDSNILATRVGVNSGESSQSFVGPIRPTVSSGYVDTGDDSVLDSVNNIYQTGKKTTSKILGPAWKLGGKANDAVTKGGLKGLKFGSDFLSSAVKLPSDLTSTDVYVKGMKNPSLYFDKMKQGRYYDKTSGKVIKSLKDIKGDVLDLDTNNVVLSGDDIKTGIFSNKGKALGNLVSSGIGKLSGYASSILSGSFAPFKWMNSIKNYAVDKLKSIPDIYVPGEKTPRMSSVLLKAGEYMDDQGKPIFNVDDIKSTVYDKTGKVVLTAEEFTKGIVDQRGKSIRSKGMKLLGGLGSLAGGVMGKLSSVPGNVIGMLRDGMSTAKNVIKAPLHLLDWMQGNSYQGGEGGVSVKPLNRIYNLLVRYAKAKGMDVGMEEVDLSDDGSDAKATTSHISKSASAFKAGLMKIKNFFKRDKKDKDKPSRVSIRDRIKSKKESLLNREGSWLNIKNARKKQKANYSKPKDDKPKKEPKSALGFLSGILNSLKGMGSVLSGIFGLVKFLPGVSTVASAAGWASRAAVAAGGFLASTAATAASAVATGASAAAAAISAPVVLTVAAVAAVAIGGYYAYKYFTKLDPLQRVRMAQYGIPLDDKDTAVMVGEIEVLCSKNIKVSGKTADVDIELSKLFTVFGIEPTSEREVNNWMTWYNKRFKPVFLQNMLIAKQFGSYKIESIDQEMPDGFKYKYAKSTRMDLPPQMSPYFVTTSPLKGLKLTRGTEIIDEEIEAIKEEFGESNEATTRRGKGRNRTKVIEKAPEIVKPNYYGKTTTLGDTKPQSVSPLRPTTEPIENTIGSPLDLGKVTKTKAGDGQGPLIKKIAKPYVKEDIETTSYNPLAATGKAQALRTTVKLSQDYNSIAPPKGSGDYSKMSGTIANVAALMDVDADELAYIAEESSDFNPSQRVKGSSLVGMYGMPAAYYRTWLGKNILERGVPRTAKPDDVVASTMAAADRLKSVKDSVALVHAKKVSEGSAGGWDGKKELLSAFRLGAEAYIKLHTADVDASVSSMGLDENLNKAWFKSEDGEPTIKQLLKLTQGAIAIEQPKGIPTNIRKAEVAKSKPLPVGRVEVKAKSVPDVEYHREKVESVRRSEDLIRHEQTRQQQQTNTAVMREGLGNSNKTLMESLSVQRNMDRTLSKILDKLNTPKSEASSTPSTTPVTPPKIKPQVNPAVSLQRKQY